MFDVPLIEVTDERERITRQSLKLFEEIDEMGSFVENEDFRASPEILQKTTKVKNKEMRF